MERYVYFWRWLPTGEYLVVIAERRDENDLDYLHDETRVVWSRVLTKGEDEEPADFRAEYERLTGQSEFTDSARPPMPNAVELCADPVDCAWDQPCVFGRRVEDYAIYCHNDGWLYAPRKCRRNRGDYRHEDCRGFKPNPDYPHGGHEQRDWPVLNCECAACVKSRR